MKYEHFMAARAATGSCLLGNASMERGEAVFCSFLQHFDCLHGGVGTPRLGRIICQEGYREYQLSGKTTFVLDTRRFSGEDLWTDCRAWQRTRKQYGWDPERTKNGSAHCKIALSLSPTAVYFVGRQAGFGPAASNDATCHDASCRRC